MPTTRHKRKADEKLLPGLPEEKRRRSSKGINSTASQARKPAAKKGKKKLDPSLPHVALANAIIERGEELRLSGTVSSSGQIFKPPKAWGHRDEPITDPTKLPEGWHANDTDVAEDDVDGQIVRCHRRIDENIMPAIFEHKLKMYQQIKQKQTDMINSEPSGLSWEVVQRLDILKKVKKSFDEVGQDNGNTSNVLAIMDAYRSGKLVWDETTVTYWVHGEMVAGPKKMVMEEFLALSQERGPHGVWVEGMDDYKPEPMYLFFYLRPQTPLHALHEIRISIRNPNTSRINTSRHTMALTVLEDTGSIAMKIFQSDRAYLEALSGAPLPVSASTSMSTAAGEVPVDNVTLQVNIFHNDQPMLPRWIDVRACINRDPPNTPPTGARLSGIWLHHMLHCLSIPDNSNFMYVGTNLSEIVASAPICNPAFAIPPPTSSTI
ncbi:hypothetical protein PITC_005560 [Penicillium italicum]|uniref:Uncharacterized protein n=1 Tax=Penicillium italicum TaxID=40296 RepID=A0A0A2LCW3_PENIT|nr:hypothetical protein PITC_005560 [Penicillium italicum]